MNDSSTDILDHRSHTIYLMTINDIPYVGKTNNFRLRRKRHLEDLRGNRHHSRYAQRLFNKHGEESVIFKILEHCTEQQAERSEVKWISVYDSFHKGLNATPGGEKGNTTPCEWNGKHYSSIAEAAKALGIKPGIMYQRIERGYSSDDELFQKTRKCIWEGVEYPSIKEAAKDNNINYATMRFYIRQGFSSKPERKPTPKPRIKIDRPVTWNGISYANVQEAAKANNISTATLQARIRKGYESDRDLKHFRPRHYPKPPK